MYRSIGHIEFPKFQTGIFVEWKALHGCCAARRMNQARKRTAGNTLLMHTASNLYIKMAASGWPSSCNTGVKVTLAELASPTKPGQHQVLTVNCIVIQFALSWFVCERNRLSLINPRVLEKTVTHAVRTWRRWTLPLLQFDHERMQLVYEFLFLKKILRNHLLSEHMQWNYASFNVKIKRLTSISFNKIIKLPK